MYVTKETLAEAIRDIIVETDKGLRAARDVSAMCRLPDSIHIEGEFLIEAGAIEDTVETIDTTPETETVETRATPQTIEVSEEERPEVVTESESEEIRPETISVRRSDRGKTTTKEIHTPPQDEQRTEDGGGDETESEQTTTYE